MYSIMEYIANQVKSKGIKCTINTTEVEDKSIYNTFIRTLTNEDNQYDLCDGIYNKQFEIIVVSDNTIDEELSSNKLDEIIEVLKTIKYVTLGKKRIISIVNIEHNYKGLNEQDLKVYDVIFGVNYVEKEL